MAEEKKDTRAFRAASIPSLPCWTEAMEQQEEAVARGWLALCKPKFPEGASLKSHLKARENNYVLVQVGLESLDEAVTQAFDVLKTFESFSDFLFIRAEVVISLLKSVTEFAKQFQKFDGRWCLVDEARERVEREINVERGRRDMCHLFWLSMGFQERSLMEDEEPLLSGASLPHEAASSSPREGEGENSQTGGAEQEEGGKGGPKGKRQQKREKQRALNSKFVDDKTVSEWILDIKEQRFCAAVVRSAVKLARLCFLPDFRSFSRLVHEWRQQAALISVSEEVLRSILAMERELKDLPKVPSWDDLSHMLLDFKEVAVPVNSLFDCRTKSYAETLAVGGFFDPVNGTVQIGSSCANQWTSVDEFVQCVKAEARARFSLEAKKRTNAVLRLNLKEEFKVQESILFFLEALKCHRKGEGGTQEALKGMSYSFPLRREKNLRRKLFNASWARNPMQKLFGVLEFHFPSHELRKIEKQTVAGLEIMQRIRAMRAQLCKDLPNPGDFLRVWAEEDLKFGGDEVDGFDFFESDEGAEEEEEEGEGNGEEEEEEDELDHQGSEESEDADTRRKREEMGGNTHTDFSAYSERYEALSSLESVQSDDQNSISDSPIASKSLVIPFLAPLTLASPPQSTPSPDSPCPRQSLSSLSNSNQPTPASPPEDEEDQQTEGLETETENIDPAALTAAAASNTYAPKFTKKNSEQCFPPKPLPRLSLSPYDSPAPLHTRSTPHQPPVASPPAHIPSRVARGNQPQQCEMCRRVSVPPPSQGGKEEAGGRSAESSSRDGKQSVEYERKGLRHGISSGCAQSEEEEEKDRERKGGAGFSSLGPAEGAAGACGSSADSPLFCPVSTCPSSLPTRPVTPIVSSLPVVQSESLKETEETLHTCPPTAPADSFFFSLPLSRAETETGTETGSNPPKKKSREEALPNTDKEVTSPSTSVRGVNTKHLRRNAPPPDQQRRKDGNTPAVPSPSPPPSCSSPSTSPHSPGAPGSLLSSRNKGNKALGVSRRGGGWSGKTSNQHRIPSSQVQEVQGKEKDGEVTKERGRQSGGSWSWPAGFGVSSSPPPIPGSSLQIPQPSPLFSFSPVSSPTGAQVLKRGGKKEEHEGVQKTQMASSLLAVKEPADGPVSAVSAAQTVSAEADGPVSEVSAAETVSAEADGPVSAVSAAQTVSAEEAEGQPL
uniref:Uncharacterized protein n=1 Tax=Chromera velia CCMP2878 TaxID=1169474 RepID=A0A0G4F477_9ALVE|eukprot:Cvel_14942.t1-p1 / transcript=Cvel_14942.t1 / gene=Cvel_14942 / organism=Chromera_velia_CCMP2878 / gene_product=hypothetical protein / transcript_product=hypothetical protein / location=Cvel_scaffold1084:13969-18068(-) / protein_length=1176 / sequence_SO=supercontig / SO=protein_coding / is_pseudo=false